MMQQIQDRGGIAILAPMIRIQPPVSWDEFDAHINRLQFTQSFYVDDMTYQGKLEL